MDSDIDVRIESELFLQKLAVFKEEHLKLKKLCIELLEENKTVRSKLQIFESKLQAEEAEDSTDTILKQQRTIIEFLKNKGNCEELRTDCDNLRRKVEILESKVQTDKVSYEQEMKKLAEKNSCQMDEMCKIYENEAKEKLDHMQKSCDELNRKNEELNIALESVEVETNEIITRIDMEHKDEIFMLKTENQLLMENLRKQEESYTQKIQMLENDVKSKTELINKLTSDRNKRSNLYQTLDEAFNTNEILINTGKSSGRKLNTNGRKLSPYITDDDNIMEEG